MAGESEPRRVGWSRRAAALAAIALSGLLCPASAWCVTRTATLVVCAPGYPGSTVEAQPAMDALAAAVAEAAGWKPGELAAAYFETERAGLERLAAPDVALALVPLPFWLKHGEALQLVPHLQAIQEGQAAAMPWSLVVSAAGPSAAADLGGFEIVSLAGYAPCFVRGPVLGSFGSLPAGVTITFSPAVLSGLRKASGGGQVAVLLDGAQAAALPTLPYAAKLKVIARSQPLPVSVLCTVGKRLPAARVEPLLAALRTLGSRADGATALAGVRMARFVTADQPALAAARAACDRALE